jgi:pSer/pThr/pTyr-binding forkhead associated (FHA) protein
MLTSPDRFLQACRGAEPIRLEVRRSSGAATVKEFPKPYVLVGRDGRADLALVNPEVAIRQLYFQLIGGRVYAVRISETPVKMSDGRSWESSWVLPSDEFCCGWVTLRVINPDQRPPGGPASGGDPVAARHTGPREYAFEPLAGRSNPPRRFTHRQDLLLVGREAPCKFLVRHASVSRFHAAIVQTPYGLWVVDLLSRTGVRVNGARVAAAELQDGDQLYFGEIGVKVCLEARRALEPQPAADGQSVDRVLEQVALMQQKTFEQFQTLLGAMMQMIGTMMNDHRRFLREELDRLERIAAPDQLPAATPPPALPATPHYANGLTEPPLANRDQIQSWVAGQLDSMNRQQVAAWEEFVRQWRTGPGGGPESPGSG